MENQLGKKRHDGAFTNPLYKELFTTNVEENNERDWRNIIADVCVYMD